MDPPHPPPSVDSFSDDISPQKSTTDDAAVAVEDDRSVYFVPLGWWKQAQESGCSELGLDGEKGIPYTATPASFYGPMKLINNIFSSDITFNLKKEDEVLALQDNNGNGEVGISCRDFALVPGEMWVQALKWHSNSKGTVKDGRTFSAAEDDMADVYPLQLKLSVLRETNTLGIRISKKDNALEGFRRACKIFNVESELLRIWDFSGQTTLLFLNDRNRNVKDPQRHSEQDIHLELQVYGLADFGRNREVKKDPLLMNGSARNSFSLRGSSSFSRNSYEAGSLGLTGLQNLGNTCFMNSSLQCLAHTPKLVDYFLGDYRREINHDNPLGMNGEIASAFGDLMKTLWAPGATTVTPRTFKSKLAHFAPQFSGFNQHDSQELLAFLLDGLHEDLNRVKCKPYSEAKDADGRSDGDVADEYWQNHLARNDSIIVDVCQGQYKSTLVCPLCKKVSITFDPFMYLSLPLPSTSMRTMSLTVVNNDGSTMPSTVTITVPKLGKFEDLIQSLSSMCSLGLDETLIVVEVYNHHIIRFLDDPSDSLSLIRDGDKLVAYRVPKDFEKHSLVVFIHQQMEEGYGMIKPSWKSFGIPLVACSEIRNGHEIRDLYLKVLKPFLVDGGLSECNNVDIVNTATASVTEEMKDSPSSGLSEAAEMMNSTSPGISKAAEIKDSSSPGSSKAAEINDSTSPGLSEANEREEPESYSSTDFDLQFHLTDEKGKVRVSRIVMDEPISSTDLGGRLYVIVSWPDKMVKRCDKSLLSPLPEIFKSGFFAKRPQESVSLYKCLEAFIKEEPLGPEDMWFCPGCKQHCQASKKLDLWRLPEILVIHLKRFSYNRYLKNKLETFVDFPVRDLDLSSYIACKSGPSCNRYMLYAISNHYGSMGGGHYTAFVRHDGDQWYDFDDSHVSAISEDKIKTSAAYVLFYRRVDEV